MKVLVRSQNECMLETCDNFHVLSRKEIYMVDTK